MSKSDNLRQNMIETQNTETAGKNYKKIFDIMRKAATLLAMDLEDIVNFATCGDKDPDPSLGNGLSSSTVRGFAYKKKVSEFSISRLQSFFEEDIRYFTGELFIDEETENQFLAKLLYEANSCEQLIALYGKQLKSYENENIVELEYEDFLEMVNNEQLDTLTLYEKNNIERCEDSIDMTISWISHKSLSELKKSEIEALKSLYSTTLRFSSFLESLLQMTEIYLDCNNDTNIEEE